MRSAKSLQLKRQAPTMTSRTCVDSLHARPSAVAGTTFLVLQALAIMRALANSDGAAQRRAPTVALLCQRQGKCESAFRQYVIGSSTAHPLLWHVSLLVGSICLGRATVPEGWQRNSGSWRFGASWRHVWRRQCLPVEQTHTDPQQGQQHGQAASKRAKLKKAQLGTLFFYATTLLCWNMALLD
jgi:hypothetical protein